MIQAVADPWLHITVQPIYAQVEPARLDALRAAAREELSGMGSFELEAGPTRIGDTAVTCYLWRRDHLAHLAQRLRA